jgi:cobalamin biosynthesis protein CobD/CbiB
MPNRARQACRAPPIEGLSLAPTFRQGVSFRAILEARRKIDNLVSGSSMNFFRGFSIVCAVSALVAVVFWICDRIANVQFTQGWILFSSLLWMVVSSAIYRHLKKKHPKA